MKEIISELLNSPVLVGSVSSVITSFVINKTRNWLHKNEINFKTYVKERNMILLKYHRKLVAAKSIVLNFAQPLQTYTDFSKLSVTEQDEWFKNIAGHIGEIELKRFKQELEYLTESEKNKRAILIEKKIRWQKANKQVVNFNNFRLDMQIFLPNDIFEDGGKIYEKLRNLYIEMEPYDDNMVVLKTTERMERAKKIEECVVEHTEKLKKVLQSKNIA